MNNAKEQSLRLLFCLLFCCEERLDSDFEQCYNTGILMERRAGNAEPFHVLVVEAQACIVMRFSWRCIKPAEKKDGAGKRMVVACTVF